MTDALQLIGTTLLIGVVMLTSRITVGHWWCRYGKEALLVWMALGMGVAVMRLLDTFNAVSASDARTLNGFVYLVAFIAMADICMAHVIYHRRATHGT